MEPVRESCTDAGCRGQPGTRACLSWYQRYPAQPSTARAYWVEVATTAPPESPTITSANGVDVRRRELGAFLRNRRERIQPEQVGVRGGRTRAAAGARPGGGA